MDPRAAKVQLERTKEIASLLSLAQRRLQELGQSEDEIASCLRRLEPEIARLELATLGRIERRHRGKHSPRKPGIRAPRFSLFLDECGSHGTGVIDENFPVFCLSGVAVPEADFPNVDAIWQAWKALNLGSAESLVHEPDVRKGLRGFASPDPVERDRLLRSLEDVIDQMDFTCIAAVVDLRAFLDHYPSGNVDDFLPQSCFLMCIDFVMERFVHYISGRDGTGRGEVVAESRGEREDAKVAAEFIRLHLEGTQFVSDSYFRYQLRPYIEFQPKRTNSSGLQIADLSARPFAERVLNPASAPARWDVFSRKLYDGGKGAPESYGLKVFPLTNENHPFPELPKKRLG